MTPKQQARINQVQAAAIQLQADKKAARAKAKELYIAEYARLKSEAVRKYHGAVSTSVDTTREKQLAELEKVSTYSYDEDDEDEYYSEPYSDPEQ